MTAMALCLCIVVTTSSRTTNIYRGQTRAIKEFSPTTWLDILLWREETHSSEFVTMLPHHSRRAQMMKRTLTRTLTSQSTMNPHCPLNLHRCHTQSLFKRHERTM
ncbi:hypothetical protein L210DRAFT_2188753 [Boletus edulis BED1]|uniref:Secreted protein n=1 Tax=Boletus edulis BED1 TaxID=1328754 RepID=A0AAD4BUY5_BOLED|nr:hypothetical protein L210DRAFT_2188753 [Boletus edulis BED1]